jgi:hypothetical protein
MVAVEARSARILVGWLGASVPQLSTRLRCSPGVPYGTGGRSLGGRRGSPRHVDEQPAGAALDLDEAVRAIRRLVYAPSCPSDVPSAVRAFALAFDLSRIRRPLPVYPKRPTGGTAPDVSVTSC